ncbi:MAG: DNA repair and recombination protein RadB [Candidatus Omnitrophica bacterium]|nr:DNA repair and recombination protein RadB [Candidatus Omnitrophota bacterium]
MEKISLAAKSVDSLIGGGLEPGVVTNVYGSWASGKTNFTIQAAVSCIRTGKKVIFIDSEGGFSVERFFQIAGEDKDLLEKVILIEPKTFEEQNNVIETLDKKLVKNDTVGLIVVDSLVSFYRLALHEDDYQKANYKLSNQLSILSKIAREKKIPVLVTNQVYSDFDSGEIQMVGRDIPRYGCKTIIKLEKLSGNKRKAIVIKHRFRPDGISTEFEIRNKGLFDVEKRFKIF